MEVITTICGNRKNFQDLKKFFEEYNLQDKKLAEFTELDKMVYLSINNFVKMM